MRRRFCRTAGAVVACAIAGFAHAASASAGNGIRLGGSDGRLHPFIDLESRYDSNISYSSSAAMGDAVFHVRPGLELKIPGDLALVEFSGALDWAQYAGLKDKTTRELSKLYAEAGFAALVNPHGAASIRLDDDFQRQISTSSLTLGSAVVSNMNTLALAVPWKPGGGALVLMFRGQWLLESFQNLIGGACELSDVVCSSQTFSGQALGDLGYNDFRSGVEAQWRFLPRTSAVFQTGYFTHVPNAAQLTIQDPGSPSLGEVVPLPKVSGVDALVGLTGLVTPHIGVSIKAGYGQTWESGGGTGTFLTDIGAEWVPIELSSLKAGYSRAFGIDPLVSTYTTNSVYVMGRVRVAQRYTLKGTVRYDNLAFEKLDGTTAFLRLEPSVEATVAPWMLVTLGYAYDSRQSSLASTATLTLPANLLASPYSKNEAWLKLGFTY